LTATEYNEYEPLWSRTASASFFRGTRRGLTDRETTMEDTHVGMMNADGGERREIGAVWTIRQGVPRWAPDGQRRLLHSPGARQQRFGAVANLRR